MYKNIIILFILMLPCHYAKSDVNSYSENGYIDWSNGYVYATGYGVQPTKYKGTGKGKLLARRAAVVGAYRNLAEIVKGVRITSTAKLVNLIQKDIVTKTKINALIKGAEIVSTKYVGSIAEVNMKMPIRQKFLNIVIPRKKLKNIISSNLFYYSFNNIFKSLPTIISNANASTDNNLVIDNEEQLDWSHSLLNYPGRDLRKPLSRAIKEFEKNSEISGLVIDARTVSDFEIAAMPRLVTSEGKSLYPSINTSYEYLTNNRPVRYENDVKNAVNHKRVSDNAMLIHSTKVYKKRVSDLIISDEDVDRLKKYISSKVSAINKARVIIVVGE